MLALGPFESACAEGFTSVCRNVLAAMKALPQGLDSFHGGLLSNISWMSARLAFLVISEHFYFLTPTFVVPEKPPSKLSSYQTEQPCWG